MDLSYQASKYYSEVRECCGNRKHQLDSAYCGSCRLTVALVESTVEEVRAEQPTPDTMETNELLDSIARIAKQESLAWATGCPAAVQNLAGAIGGHISREILKLKEPPQTPTMVETLEGKYREYHRSWRPAEGVRGTGVAVPYDPVLRAPDSTPHSMEDPDG